MPVVSFNDGHYDLQLIKHYTAHNCGAQELPWLRHFPVNEMPHGWSNCEHWPGPGVHGGPKYLKCTRARSTTYSYWCWHGNSDGGQTPCEPWWCPLKHSAYRWVALTDAPSGGGIWKLYLLNWGTVCSRWRVGMMRQRRCRACQASPSSGGYLQGPRNMDRSTSTVMSCM